MAELAPAPRLDDLEELVRHTKHTGVHVDLRVEGEPRRLAPGWRSRPIALPRRR
jgi:hypothetical protein